MSGILSSQDEALDALGSWYESYRQHNGSDPDRYVVCAGLVIVERFQEAFPLDRANYVTERNQLRGAGRATIQRILKKYGEERLFAAEGGRTTRGAVTAGDALAIKLNVIRSIADLDEEQRKAIASQLERWLANKAIDYFNRERIKLDIEPSLSMDALIKRILQDAQRSGPNKGGAVAQHLVGAKLAIRFESTTITIENHRANAADLQTGRHGDFQINDTVFHVTLSPAPPVIAKCKENIKNGYRVVLLVPDESLEAAKQLARLSGIEDQMGNQSLSTFIAQNIQELGHFSSVQTNQQLGKLLRTYNDRVAQIETDLSLMFEIPDWLQRA